MTVYVFFLLMVKHFICDFALQGRFKHQHDKYKLSSIKGLLHALDHALGTALVFLFFASWCFAQGQTVFSSIILFGVLDFICHLKIDWLKNNFVVANDMNQDQRQYWILTSIDQIFHTITYLIFVVVFDIYFF